MNKYLMTVGCRLPESDELLRQMEVQVCLKDLYAAGEDQNTNPVIDLIIDMVAALLHRRPTLLDAVLEQVDVVRLPTDAMIALLMETYRGKAVLPSRAELCQRVESRLRDTRPSEASEMMLGLS